MKLNKILICGAVVMTMLHSCRDNDEYVPSYVQDDFMTFSHIESFETQFTAMWKAVSTNYAAWDIETVDWDAVHAKYLPKFVELDTIVARGGKVEDETLQALYTEILDTLHDGHCNYSAMNFSTKKHALMAPQKDRNKRRYGADYQKDFECNIDYYASSFVPENERIDEMHSVNMSCKDVLRQKFTMGMLNLKKALSQAETKEQQEYLTAAIARFQRIIDALSTVSLGEEGGFVTLYNQLVDQYAEAQMTPYLTTIKAGDRMNITSCVTKDGIAYLYISAFKLTTYLEMTDAEISNLRAQGLEQEAEMFAEFKKSWNFWFSSIQTLKAAGKLKGVIIDVRNNGGGNVPEMPYVMGALLPSGGYKAGTYKMKSGPGRLDYTADLDLIFSTRSDEHAVIDSEPIVVLANHQSVSCAEMTSVIAKQLPNAVLIGKQTHGGLSMIYEKENYGGFFAGTFGVYGQTIIAGYQPMMLASYTGLGVLEGIGATPDYDVDYVSTPRVDSQGNVLLRDSQFEAALNYIRNR